MSSPSAADVHRAGPDTLITWPPAPPIAGEVGGTHSHELHGVGTTLLDGDTGGTGSLHMVSVHTFIQFLLEVGVRAEERILALILAQRLDLEHQAGFLLVASHRWEMPADSRDRYQNLASELFRRARPRRIAYQI